MMPGYIPNTPAEQRQMLTEIGLDDFSGLFSELPEQVMRKEPLRLPKAVSEMELMPLMREISSKNRTLSDCTCFLGAGAYDHYIPAVIRHLVSRQEFSTAYTPYQPEISQGTLQAIFEYQTMICALTGMDVANASMYDGATALAEAASMACSVQKRKTVLVCDSVNPQSREVMDTYARSGLFQTAAFASMDGAADLAALEGALDGNTAAVVIQSPNFFGLIERLGEAARLAHENGALLIVSCDPISLGLLKSPGELGADIAVGEGQPLGGTVGFGGSSLGFFAVKKRFMRKMPGRIAGMTTDRDGKTSYVLTLQAREQHIRREKATSNICSNQALNALTAAVYLSVMGKKGIGEVARACMQKAHYAYDRLLATNAFSPVFRGPFFCEFALRYHGDLDRLNRELLNDKIIGGLNLGRSCGSGMDRVWLVAVTEKRTKREIDRLAERAAKIHDGV